MFESRGHGFKSYPGLRLFLGPTLVLHYSIFTNRFTRLYLLINLCNSSLSYVTLHMSDQNSKRPSCKKYFCNNNADTAMVLITAIRILFLCFFVCLFVFYALLFFSSPVIFSPWTVGLSEGSKVTCNKSVVLV